MSDASAGADTGPGDQERTYDAASQVQALVDQWFEFGRRALERATGRAQDNIKLVRERQYGVDSMLDDVKWFWDGVAQDTSELVKGVQNLRPRR